MALKYIGAVLISVFCISSAAEEFGQITNNINSGDWSSYRVCGSDGICLWRASTNSTNRDESFVLDWPENNYTDIPVAQTIVGNIPFDAMKSWNTDSDIANGKFRVDLNPIREFQFSRNLNRGMRTIFYNFPPTTVNESFIQQLKLGNTLRFRQTINARNFTTIYSLKGAAQAIKRAQESAKNAFFKQKDGYDPYFDNPYFNTPQIKEDKNQEIHF